MLFPLVVVCPLVVEPVVPVVDVLDAVCEPVVVEDLVPLVCFVVPEAVFVPVVEEEFVVFVPPVVWLATLVWCRPTVEPTD